MSEALHVVGPNEKVSRERRGGGSELRWRGPDARSILRVSTTAAETHLETFKSEHILIRPCTGTSHIVHISFSCLLLLSIQFSARSTLTPCVPSVHWLLDPEMLPYENRMDTSLDAVRSRY